MLSLEHRSDLQVAVWWRHTEAPEVADAMIKALKRLVCISQGIRIYRHTD